MRGGGSPEQTGGGKTARSECVFWIPARASHLSLVGLVVQWYGQHVGLSDEACYELEVAVDEACTNVMRYAYPADQPGGITIRCTPLACGVQVDILDQGKPFDPDEGTRVAQQKQLQDPASGGLGLAMIRQFADDFRHQWGEQEGNRLTIIKYPKETKHGGRSEDE